MLSRPLKTSTPFFEHLRRIFCTSGFNKPPDWSPLHVHPSHPSYPAPPNSERYPTQEWPPFYDSKGERHPDEYSGEDSKGELEHQWKRHDEYSPHWKTGERGEEGYRPDASAKAFYEEKGQWQGFKKSYPPQWGGGGTQGSGGGGGYSSYQKKPQWQGGYKKDNPPFEKEGYRGSPFRGGGKYDSLKKGNAKFKYSETVPFTVFGNQAMLMMKPVASAGAFKPGHFSVTFMPRNPNSKSYDKEKKLTLKLTANHVGELLMLQQGEAVLEVSGDHEKGEVLVKTDPHQRVEFVASFKNLPLMTVLMNRGEFKAFQCLVERILPALYAWDTVSHGPAVPLAPPAPAQKNMVAVGNGNVLD